MKMMIGAQAWTASMLSCCGQDTVKKVGGWRASRRSWITELGRTKKKNVQEKDEKVSTTMGEDRKGCKLTRSREVTGDNFGQALKPLVWRAVKSNSLLSLAINDRK